MNLKNWVVLQLSEKGELVLENDPIIIENILIKFLKGSYFLPLFYDKNNNFNNKMFLFKGYIFVEYLEKDIIGYDRLANSPYFIGPLVDSSKKYCFVKEEEITRFKKQLNALVKPNINLNDKVIILDGKYKNLEAKVTEIYKDIKTADLIIELKCMQIIVPQIPLMYLKNLNKEVNLQQITNDIEEKKESPKKNSSKNNLLTKLITLLTKYTEGLTRKELLLKGKFSDHEKKQVSAYLVKGIKRKVIKSIKKKNKRSKYILKK